MPTPIFICGAECGLTDAHQPAAPGTRRHWSAKIGSVTLETTIVRPGGSTRSHRFTGSGAASRHDLQFDFPTPPTVAVARAYVYFGSFPTAAVGLVGFVSTGAIEYSVGYNPLTQQLEGKAGAIEAGGFDVELGVWYRIDVRAEVSGTTHTVDWQVAINDGTPVVGTQASRAGSADTLASFRYGLGITSSPVTFGEVYVDDAELSVTTGDYPLGAAVVAGRSPGSDDTHNFNLAGDFKAQNTTNIGIGATDSWSKLTTSLGGISNFISTVGASGEYLGWKLVPAPAMGAVHGVEAVSAHHASGTAANAQTMRMIDAGNTVDIFTDADFSTSTTLTIHAKAYATKPSGGAWTKAALDALVLRWSPGFGVVDVSPVPFIDGVVFEIAFTPVAANPWVMEQALACSIVEQMSFGPIPPGSNPAVARKKRRRMAAILGGNLA
jgi:hypothetical protein